MKGDSDVSIVTLTHGKISQNVKRNGNDCSAVHTSEELQYEKDNQKIVVHKAMTYGPIRF